MPIRIAMGGCSIDDLARELGMDRELVLTLTDRLRRDLYLTRARGRLHFRARFLRRFWRLERGLPEDRP